MNNEEPAAQPAHQATAAGLSHGRKLIIFGIMAFGQFMALLDTQIVAASLNSIQAGLSAGPDEIAWVQTSYLMAEIVMIPLAAYLSQALSTRWLFTASAVLFTITSLMCGFAWSITSMTVFRAIQGFVGGAMVPTVFATGFAMFSGKQARDDPGDPRTGFDSRADLGAVSGRLDHGYIELALAVFRQRGAGPFHRHRIADSRQGR